MRSLVSVVVSLVAAAVMAEETSAKTCRAESDSESKAEAVSAEKASPSPGAEEEKPSAAGSGLSVAEAGPTPGTIGLRVTFMGSQSPNLPPGATNGGPSIPPTSIGLKVVATRSLALTFDAGLTSILGSQSYLGAGLGVGAEYYLRDHSPLRPFITAGTGFSKSFTDSTIAPQMVLSGGLGAEYFFSPYFSAHGRALLVAPISLGDGERPFVLATVTPGLGGTFYF